MASVKIDLGFGEQAILSDRAAPGTAAVKHQRDAEEFLRRWPQTRSIQQARDYLRQLGLHVAYNPPGVNRSDTIALLRAAVKSGKVMVLIERARKPSGGSVTRRSAPVASSRQSFTEMAAARSTPATLTDAVSAPKNYSWMQHYDDVSADDLIAYIQSVIGGTPAATTVPEADPATPLGDAQPFEFSEDAPIGDVQQDAGFFLTPEIEDECMQQHFIDMDDCSAMWSWGTRRWGMCKEQASMRLSRCLTGKGEID